MPQIDVSKVRVHHDGASQQLARSVQARAFTFENNVVLGKGEFAPGTDSGRRLMAHELAHVAQQGKARAGRVSREPDRILRQPRRNIPIRGVPPEFRHVVTSTDGTPTGIGTLNIKNYGSLTRSQKAALGALRDLVDKGVLTNNQQIFDSLRGNKRLPLWLRQSIGAQLRTRYSDRFTFRGLSIVSLTSGRWVFVSGNAQDSPPARGKSGKAVVTQSARAIDAGFGRDPRSKRFRAGRGLKMLRGASLVELLAETMRALVRIYGANVKKQDARAQLEKIQKQIDQLRKDNPGLGVLVYRNFFRPVDVTSPLPERILNVDIYTGTTVDQALLSRGERERRGTLLPGSNTEILVREPWFWIPPKTATQVEKLQPPSPVIGTGTFANDWRVRKVLWISPTDVNRVPFEADIEAYRRGFDDEGNESIDQKKFPGVTPRFYVLDYLNMDDYFSYGNFRKSNPKTKGVTADGTTIPLFNMDPLLGSFVKLAMIFPMDNATEKVFQKTTPTINWSRLSHLVPNFSRVRWVAAEDIRMPREF